MKKKRTTTTTRRKRTTTTRRKRTTTNNAARAIDAGDRKRLLSTLATWADAGSFIALRTRAFVLLCWSSGLRFSEACALDAEQVIDGGSIRATAYLRSAQSRGRAEGGAFVITTSASAALRAYLGGRATGPLFVARSEAERLSVRSAQHAWDALQRRAQVAQHYKASDLRFDALTRVSTAARGHVHRVQMFGRFSDVRTASRYVRQSATSLAELSELAARAE